MSTTIKLSGIALEVGGLVDAAACKYEHESMARYAVQWVMRDFIFEYESYRVWTPLYPKVSIQPSEWLITRLEDLVTVGYVCLWVDD